MRLLALVVVTGFLAACGQTGPLHLPQDAPAKEGYLLKKRRDAGTKPAPATPPVETPTPAASPQ